MCVFEGSVFNVLLLFVLAWAVITKYHRLGDLNKRNLFLTVLEA